MAEKRTQNSAAFNDWKTFVEQIYVANHSSEVTRNCIQGALARINTVIHRKILECLHGKLAQL